MYPISGARVSMQRRKLQITKLSKDETRCHPYESMQEKNERWLSYLQAIDSALLLSRKTLPRNEMFGTILFEYKT